MVAPLGPGVYELRNSATSELVLFGYSKNVASRMSSLLPPPYGTGNRNNREKKEYVLEHLVDMEYRTRACPDKKTAQKEEQNLRARNYYLFNI